MQGSLSTDEDTFLPNENDKLKAQIQELRRRLAIATERDKQLKRELIEENLSFVTVSHLTRLIQDPTRLDGMEEFQKEIFNKLMTTANKCIIREMISYHRLSGRSIFQFTGDRSCIRLETFYNKSYREPYYILYSKGQTVTEKPFRSNDKPNLIEQHTIPRFIPLYSLEDQFLPHNFDTFIRIVHAQLQAYVSRREMAKEIDQLGKSGNAAVCIKYHNESVTNLKIQLDLKEFQNSVIVDITIKDKSSIFPTDIVIRPWKKGLSTIEAHLEDQLDESFLDEEQTLFFTNLKRDLTFRNMKDVFLDLVK